jgi:hypothetical protein
MNTVLSLSLSLYIYIYIYIYIYVYTIYDVESTLYEINYHTEHCVTDHDQITYITCKLR